MYEAKLNTRDEVAVQEFSYKLCLEWDLVVPMLVEGGWIFRCYEKRKKRLSGF